jgi:hypothetical protein
VDGTPSEEPLPLLGIFNLLGGALVNTWTDQHTCQWLTNALYKHRLNEKNLIRVTDAKDLSKPVKMALGLWA